MKKLKTLAFALLAVLVGACAAHAAGPYGTPCNLINNMGGVFKVLRNLCFAGAAFVLMGWAWGYISKGKAEMDDIKTKGVGMLIGFALLFGVGLIMSFLPGIMDCPIDW
jgi:hypothetical protein